MFWFLELYYLKHNVIVISMTPLRLISMLQDGRAKIVCLLFEIFFFRSRGQMSLMLLGGDGHFNTFSVVMLAFARGYHALVFLVILTSSIVMKFAKYLLRHEHTLILRCARVLLICYPKFDSYRTHVPFISRISLY